MSSEAVIAGFLRIAKEDLDGAKLLARQNNRNAVYLCEQAAEKIIRAILTAEGQHAGRMHKLDEMVDLVADENPLKAALRQVEVLTAYATAYRYPTPVGRILPPPSALDFDAMMARVEVLLDKTASCFGVILTQQAGPAGNARPIR
jgi:HEPN domain-containing protein